MLKLYDYPDCPFAQKVRVVLAEKDLEFERVFVDRSGGPWGGHGAENSRLSCRPCWRSSIRS